MGGPMEKSFEEMAKQAEETAKVPVAAIVGAVGIITEGLNIKDIVDQAIPPADKKEETNG